MDATSGQVIYEIDSHARRSPASVTKIMTANIAIERGKLNDWVTVNYDPEPLNAEQSSMMWVNPGERIRLEDLVYGLMLPSGNDAAEAIANYIAGSDEAFVKLMNDKAQELGMKDTHYANPHGLDQEGHYTSAYDLALLARYAMQNPNFRQFAAAKIWTVRSLDRTWDVYNLNKLLFIYPDADGIKIGYTDSAGKTIVASVNHEGHRVIAVLLGSWNLWADTPALYDWAFANYTWPVSDVTPAPSPSVKATPSP
jgi:serine-type D-Ala-D-Ala carboxypeptidase (penicillin-binding protein 5/6)